MHRYEQDNVLYFVEHWNKHVVLYIDMDSQILLLRI